MVAVGVVVAVGPAACGPALRCLGSAFLRAVRAVRCGSDAALCAKSQAQLAFGRSPQLGTLTWRAAGRPASSCWGLGTPPPFASIRGPRSPAHPWLSLPPNSTLHIARARFVHTSDSAALLLSSPRRAPQVGAMTMWEDLMNCICQNGPQRPGMQELLSTLERHTVCTGTQCFEGESEAFGLTTTGNQAPTDNTMFFMFMMCADARAARRPRARRRERRLRPHPRRSPSPLPTPPPGRCHWHGRHRLRRPLLRASAAGS